MANQHAPGRFHILDLTSGLLPTALQSISFNTVISTEVIEHLYDPRSFLNFARRILEKSDNGKLIISTPYHGYLKNLVMAISGKMDAHHTVLWDGGHIKFFSKSTLEKMLSDQGFMATAFKGAGRMPWLWKSMLMSAVTK